MILPIFFGCGKCVLDFNPYVACHHKLNVLVWPHPGLCLRGRVAPASPYPAPAPSFTPRPALGGAGSFTPAPFRAPTPLALTPAPAPAHTPADAQITKPGLPTSSMRVALANARMGTAAPDAAAAAPVPAIKLTPHPKSVRATARNVTFGTLGVPYGAGPSGVKRGRDHEAHAATPLLGSGIKNLSGGSHTLACCRVRHAPTHCFDGVLVGQ